MLRANESLVVRGPKTAWGAVAIGVVAIGARAVRIGERAGFTSVWAWALYLAVGGVALWALLAALRHRVRATADRLEVRTAFRTRVYPRHEMADALVVGVDARTRMGRLDPDTSSGGYRRTTVVRALDGRCLVRLPPPSRGWRGGTVTDALEAMGVPVAHEPRTWTPADLDRYAPGATTWPEHHWLTFRILIVVGILAAVIGVAGIAEAAGEAL